MKWFPADRMKVFTLLAFASVVITTFAQFAFTETLRGTTTDVVVTFLLGGAFFLLASFCNELTDDKPRWRLLTYFVVQTTLVLGAIWISPARGFFAIIALPLVSQALFDLKWRGSTAVIVACFLGSITIWAEPYGLPGVARAAVSYLAGYFFTIVFSILAREAIAARHIAESLSRDLTAANDQLRANAAAVDELATTRERNRLAREIHDGVGHYLTVIKVQLDAASALLPAEPARAAASVTTAARLAGEALDDVRRSVGTLATDVARPPLTESLRHLVADAVPGTAVQVEGAPRSLGAAAEHALYRVAQEGLTNLRKHAAATEARVTLDFRDAARVRLSVVDNGRGLTAMTRGANAGYGLRGLQERIAVLGGKLTAANRPEGGFALVAEVPA